MNHLRLSRNWILWVIVAYWVLGYGYIYQPAVLSWLSLPLLKALPILVLTAVVTFKLGRAGCMMAAGLLLSACGDIAGDVPGGGIIPQIGFFMLAQIVYASVFRKDARWRPMKLVTIIPVISWLLYMAYRLFHSPKLTEPVMQIAVGLYLVVISAMVVTSILRQSRYQLVVTIGAMLFVFSDSVIAWNRFLGYVPESGSLIMWSYYMAQFLIGFGYIKDHSAKSTLIL